MYAYLKMRSPGIMVHRMSLFFDKGKARSGREYVPGEQVHGSLGQSEGSPGVLPSYRRVERHKRQTSYKISPD